MNVCPVVEEEMDDDVMDDQEEPSEESRPVEDDADIERTTRALADTSSLSKLVQTLCRCTTQQPCSQRSKVSNSDRRGHRHEASEL